MARYDTGGVAEWICTEVNREKENEEKRREIKKKKKKAIVNANEIENLRKCR